MCNTYLTFLSTCSARPLPRPQPFSVMPLEDSPAPKAIEIAEDSRSDIRSECSVCLEPGQNVVFDPCGDCIVCQECAVRMKRCLTCHQPIARKVTKGKK